MFAISHPYTPVMNTLIVKNKFPVSISLYSIEIEDSRFTTSMTSGGRDGSTGMVAAIGSDWVCLFVYSILGFTLVAII